MGERRKPPRPPALPRGADPAAVAAAREKVRAALEELQRALRPPRKPRG